MLCNDNNLYTYLVHVVMASPREKDPRFFLFGTFAAATDKEIAGSRLPTVKQVMLCFLAHHAEYNVTIRDAANATVQKVLPFYLKARIPTLAPQKMAEEIEKLYHKMRSLMKIREVKRDMPKEKARILEFKDKLEKTMKFWPRNAMERITLEEDRQFLLSMINDREASMGTVDGVLSKSERKITERRNREAMQQKKEEMRVADSPVLATLVDFADDQDQENETPSSSTDSYQLETQKGHKRIKKVGTPGYWTHDVLKHPAVVESAVRNKISTTALTDLAHSFLAATGGNPEKVTLSNTSTYRYMVSTVIKISDKIKSSWMPPTIAVIHWDGKLMDTLGNDYGTEERLPILVSGVGGVKLLGVPALTHKSTEKIGPQISRATKELLDDWKCSDNISGMVFDTTSSNTGGISAACISIQSALSRFLLWLACRHHVGEVVLTVVWDSLQIEVSKSPDISLFTRFKENFEHIDYNDLQDLDVPDIPSSVSDPIKDLCHKVLKTMVEGTTTNLGRGDYKELVELTLVYLGETSGFKGFRRPGALHKARWMSKILYSIKIVLLNKKIEGTVLGRGQLPRLKRFIKFVVTCYVPWWLTASIASTAPYNDLNFINTALLYEDSVVSKAALTALSRHMWYLTEELVPLSLFSKMKDEVKEKIRIKLLTYEKLTAAMKRKGTEYGKPQFPPIPTSPDQDLTNFIGQDSWMFFHILKLDTSFLELPAKDWANDPAYNSCKEIVSNLCVVNDAAERGVKLCYDFLPTAKKDKKLQEVLQVVENSRNKLPNMRKRQLKSKNWFLALDN